MFDGWEVQIEWNLKEHVMYTEKYVLVYKEFANILRIGLSLRVWAEKTVNGVETYGFTVK